MFCSSFGSGEGWIEQFCERRGREDQFVVRDFRFFFGQDFFRPFDRADVVHVGLDLRLVDRVVDVVDPGLRRGWVGGPDRDHHVVRPEDAAFFRHPPFDVRVVRLQLHRVAGPADRGDHVAVGQVGRVVVAGEAPDLPRFGGALDFFDRFQPVRFGGVFDVDAFALHHQRHGVAKFVQHVDLALVFGVEQVADRVDVGRLLFVHDHAGHPRLPWSGELSPGVVGGAAQVVGEVFLEVRNRRRFEFLQIAEFVHFLRHPVGHDEEAAPAPVACRARSGCCRPGRSATPRTTGPMITSPRSWTRCRAAGCWSSTCGPSISAMPIAPRGSTATTGPGACSTTSAAGPDRTGPGTPSPGWEPRPGPRRGPASPWRRWTGTRSCSS